MNKTRKIVVVLLMVFGSVSVSFGVDLVGNEENYQKLKAEVEEYGGVEDCKWSEDGKIISGDLCRYKNVIAFFDEIRAKEVKVESCKKRYWARNCYPVDKFGIAVEEVRGMPRFKEDSSIYNYKWKNKEIWWERVFDEWDKTKRQLRMDGARSGYWKKMAE